jgi:hypothetical protein
VESSVTLVGNVEAKPLEVRDLVRLTRITVDLNRLTQQHQRAEQTTSRRYHSAAPLDQAAANPASNSVSDPAYRAIRTALRDDPRSAPLSPLAPAEADTPAEPIESASNLVAHEAQLSTIETIQPRLTAPGRTSPHPGGLPDSSQPCRLCGPALNADTHAFGSQDSGCSPDVEQADVA